MQFIDLQSQLNDIRSKIDQRIGAVLNHGKFIHGPEVNELEEKLAAYTQRKHCITCANGTDALQLALMSLGVGTNDLVFTTSFSFFATAEVIPLVGATPYFCDIEPDTFNLSAASLEQAIIDAKLNNTGTPKAVITADMFGLPADYEAIQAICHKYNLALVEDAAQSFGGSIRKSPAGSFGKIATTSFFPAKPLGCYGDGGAIFTDDDELAFLCQSLRVHGKGKDKYDNVRIGLNSRLDTLQAAILIEKLNIFDIELEQRQHIAQHYRSALPSSAKLQSIKIQYTSGYAQFSVLLNHRDKIKNALSAAGIPSQVYYPQPLSRASAFKNINTLCQSDCNALDVSQKILSLPFSPYIKVDEVDRVCEVLTQATKPLI